MTTALLIDCKMRGYSVGMLSFLLLLNSCFADGGGALRTPISSIDEKLERVTKMPLMIGSKSTRFSPPMTEHCDRITIQNMTCSFFTQPLNHFVPRGRSPSYEQRYCVYNEFAEKNSTSPILFYTGNESPLEQYINHTGLMWELAPVLKARVVFVEHRYEGESLPNVGSDCLSYASTIQALADYARILEENLNPHNKAPVFAFGGSYGGMLSAWFRMKYPHLVAGAIAGSAPTAAFPQSANEKIDWSARVLAAGLSKPYPPNGSTKQEPNHCNSNLLAAWPLISWIAQQNGSDDFLQNSFRLCEPLNGDAPALLRWAQAIWFDMGEGSFPYPSSYIPFSLLHKKVNLPPWPTQDACWKSSTLHKDWGVDFSGNLSNVNYSITYGDSGLSLDVDWDEISVRSSISLETLKNSTQIGGLLRSVRDAVSVWYNITKDVKCFNVSQEAPNKQRINQESMQSRHLLREKKDPIQVCHDAMKEMGSWPPLCCNDEINMVMTFARGMGSDFFWPPSHPRSISTYSDIAKNMNPVPCLDPDGLYGFSKEPYDPWSTWLEAYYGSGLNMDGHSNIVFSNGLLDPWSAGGVYAEHPWEDPPYSGPMVQQITKSDVIALIIENGGHHTDLMYSSKSDSEDITRAREIEHDYLVKWIDNFWKSK
eukprot:scaffold3827_cov179-Cylindrotheca_fusiformis.AAC.39